MKKICLASCLCFATQVAFCKVDSLGINDHKLSKQPYFRLGMGYGVGLSPDVSTIKYTIANTGTYRELSTYSQDLISFGRGGTAVAALGYYVGNCIAVEAAFSPGLWGGTYTMRNKTDSSNYVERVKSTPAGTLQLNIMMHTPGKRGQLYARAGVVASFASKITSTIEGNPRLGYTARQTAEARHKTAAGFNGALGFRKEVSRNVHLWAEAATVMLAPYLDEMKITDLEVNGTNITSYLQGDQATQKYDFSGTITDRITGTLRTGSDPFSNASINVGVTFDMEQHLSKKTGSNARGFFFTASLGYVLPLATKTASIDGEYAATYLQKSTTPKEERFSVNPASFSVGTVAKAAIGYMLSRHMGIECDAWLGLGGKEYLYASERYIQSGSWTTLEEKTLTTSKAQSPLIIIPAVVLTTGESRVSGHIRTGVVLPVKAAVVITEEEYQPAATTGAFRIAKSTLKTNFVIGASISAGASFSVAQRVRIVTEITGISYAPSAKSTTLTQLSQSGVNILDKVPEDERTITYERSGTYGPGATNGNIRPSYTLPFSGLAFTAGVNVSM